MNKKRRAIIKIRHRQAQIKQKHQQNAAIFDNDVLVIDIIARDYSHVKNSPWCIERKKQKVDYHDRNQEMLWLFDFVLF
jgi:hypothetical protein